MHFSDVLDMHESSGIEGSHRDILGDGFLLQSNPIYRNIRSLALKIGCKYVEAYPDYLLLPFHELPKIIESKKIPFVPSARLMKSVELNNPGVFSTQEMPMPESYHLHESAHVIADHFFKNLKLSTPQEQILKALLGESFANTVDALAGISARDDIHLFFIKQNCYMHPRKRVSEAMSALIESKGFRFNFMLTYFTYLQANFLAKPLSKKAVRELLERYASSTEISSKAQKDIQAVCGIGEKLDPNFRTTTTGNYLKQQGFEGEIYDLLDFSFIKVFDKNPGFRKAVEALCDSIA